MTAVGLFDELEAHLAAFNLSLWLEGVGLPFDAEEAEWHGLALAESAGRLLDLEQDSPAAAFALEHWSEGQLWPLNQKVNRVMDEALVLPELLYDGAALSWRNWRVFQRTVPSAETLREVFERFVDLSVNLRPVAEERHARERENYARWNATCASVFVRREGISLHALRDILHATGATCRPHFERRFRELGERVFGRTPGPALGPAPGAAELHALNNNRMYDWLGARWAGVDALAETQRTYARLGFDLARIPLDLEDRPGKYAGAFCFPIRTPGDVRVSVRIASPHHLLDMLFHEFGHAAHFSGIDPALSVIDRCWIHSGTHETFSTLFELLLDDPLFVKEHFGADDALAAEMAEFGKYKAAWVGTYSSAGGLAALDGWMENLAWEDYEARCARYLREFTGLDFPPGYARIDGFTRTMSVYPAGYVMAYLRCSHWLAELRLQFGERWWANAGAGDAIRERIRPGGAVQWPDGWLNIEAFQDLYTDDTENHG